MEEPRLPLTTDEKLLTISRDALKAFEKLDGGIHPGFRPLHAKGILLSDVFTPSSEASSLTSAPHINICPEQEPRVAALFCTVRVPRPAGPDIK